MKTRKLRILLSVMALCLAIATLFAACEKKTPDETKHTHDLSNGYSKDADNHWQTCSGCDERLNLEAHKWSEWATTDDEGGSVSSRYCTVCNEKQIEENGGNVTDEIVFEDVDETVYVSNSVSTLVLRSSTDFDSDDNKVAWLSTGTELKRTGYHEEWSRVEHDGKTLYCSSKYLTKVDPSPEITIEFTKVNEKVVVDTTGATHPDGTIPQATYYNFPFNPFPDDEKAAAYLAGYLSNDTKLTRTGIYNENSEGSGWSRIEIDGKTYYIRNSMIKIDESADDNGEVQYPDFDYMGNDISDFINMSEYKGLLIEIEPRLVITEEYFAVMINREIIFYGEYNEIKDRTVTKDDIVKIKYEGYLNGEKFEGGTGDAEYFTIYDGGGFIDGFADGIIGAEVGKQFDLNVTFPEDYHSEDLAGKAVVFKVTVEFIYEAKEMTDELVKELSGGQIKTYEEFKKQAWDILQEEADAAYENSKITAVWDHIMENSTAKNIPDELIKNYVDYITYYYKQYAEQYYMTFEDFCKAYGITEDSIREEAVTEIIYETVLFSIIKAENITLSDEEYKEMLKEMADSNGVTEDVVLMYYTEEELREMFLTDKAYDSVVELNTFADKTAE